MRFERLHGFAITALGSAGQAHHHGLAGAINICIQQAHTGALGSQRQRQIGRGGGLAHAAFARRHGNDVFHLRQQGHAGLRRMGNHFGCDLGLDRGHTGHLPDHMLQLLLKRSPQAFGGVAQFHLETHIAALELQVFDRFAADEVLTSERVHHGFQCVGDVLFAQGHRYSSVSVGQKGTSLTSNVIAINCHCEARRAEAICMRRPQARPRLHAGTTSAAADQRPTRRRKFCLITPIC